MSCTTSPPCNLAAIVLHIACDIIRELIRTVAAQVLGKAALQKTLTPTETRERLMQSYFADKAKTISRHFRAARGGKQLRRENLLMCLTKRIITRKGF
jgi:hypothetical protein